jgi:CheY-like chemotaxis protein
VLVADDDPTVCKLFSFIIRSNFPELRVSTVDRGTAAVEEFLKDRHSVIIMDLRMPDMDGIRAFQEISENCRKKKWDVPSVIFCTGFVPPPALEEIDGFGETHKLLRKPVTGTDLCEAIKERL